MIKITAESKGNQIEFKINIDGAGKDVVAEAVHIMQQLPEHIRRIDKPLFFYFLASLTETGMFDVGVKQLDPEEDDDKEETNASN